MSQKPINHEALRALHPALYARVYGPKTPDEIAKEKTAARLESLLHAAQVRVGENKPAQLDANLSPWAK